MGLPRVPAQPAPGYPGAPQGRSPESDCGSAEWSRPGPLRSDSEADDGLAAQAATAEVVQYLRGGG